MSKTWRIALAVVMAAQTAAAQKEEIPQKRPDSATVRAHRKLFTHRDLVMAGAFTATTLLLAPLDRQLARDLQDSSVQANSLLKDVSSGVEVIATPGAYFIGGTLYAFGRIAGKPRIADLGWHGTEAVLLGELTSYLLKGTVGRARPFVAIDDPDDFKLGRGFSGGQNWRSFPSGHATTAFAAAAAVTDETTLWWPRSTWIVGPLMYGGATMVAVSRMYHNRHWASDVAVGALIGTFSGKKVVLASHSNPGNIIDRVMLRGFIAPSEFGTVKIGWGKSW